MMIRIACADTNTAYLDRLYAVLGEYPELHLSVYTDAAILCDAAKAGKFDVLLLDASIYTDALPLDRIPGVIFLGGETPIPAHCTHFPIIPKYRRISEIYRRILEICSENKKLSVGMGFGGGSAAVITVWSPVGGAGKTTAALVAASRLAAHGKRVLYVNLEAFPSDSFYFGHEAGVQGLSALMERLDDKEEHTKMFVKSCAKQKAENFFYLPHFDSPNDYAAVDAKELTALAALLRGCGYYDVLLFDMDSSFDARTRAMFGASDRILLVGRTDGASTAKLDAFLAQTYLVDEYGAKMMYLANFTPQAQTSVTGFAANLPSAGRMTYVNTTDSAALIGYKATGPESGFALRLAE